MAETAQVQSTASEEQVRQSVVQALAPHGGQIEENAPGRLVIDVGSVGKAFLAGPFRNAMKMPQRITLTTQAGGGGTGIGVEVGTHGTGGGYMSGGVFGVMKSRKAAKSWMQIVLDAIPGKVGGAAPTSTSAGTGPPDTAGGETPPAPPPPPEHGSGSGSGPGGFTG